MRYIHITFLLAVMAMLLFSCKKSENTAELNSLNKITVETADSIFTVQQLDTLRISPNLMESIPGSGPYNYNWKAYLMVTPANVGAGVTQTGDGSFQLSNDKNLKSSIALPPGTYYLQYTITDTKTGVKTFRRFQLAVNGTFYEGWIVVSNKAGKGLISFIRKDDVIYRDPVAAVNGFTLEGKALAAYSGVISKLAEINVFTDQAAYRFRANDFVLSGSTEHLFNESMTFADPYYSVNYINTDQYIFNSGSVYATIAPNFGAVGKYSDRFAGPDYELFPFIMPGSKYAVTVYDNKNKRFLQTGYNSRELKLFGSTAGAPFDMTNIGKTMVAVDRNLGQQYYCIMKDDTGYFFYAINTSLAAPAVLMQPMLNSPGVANAVTFAASSTLPLMYYGVDNKIYVYDVLANAARLVYQFPAGVNVRDIEMYKSKGWGTFTNNLLINNRLVAATYNGAEGEVYYFDLATTGDFVNSNYVTKFGGFGDIVQINYRNPNI